MDQTLKEMNTYQTTSTCRYNLNFFKRSMLILLLLCISFMIPGISLTALGADVTEPGKSYLLDNLSYPSDNALNKRPSLVRDIIAKSGETELPTLDHIRRSFLRHRPPRQRPGNTSGPGVHFAHLVHSVRIVGAF
jgi:hypothetical protein